MTKQEKIELILQDIKSLDFKIDVWNQPEDSMYRSKMIASKKELEERLKLVRSSIHGWQKI